MSTYYPLEYYFDSTGLRRVVPCDLNTILISGISPVNNNPVYEVDMSLNSIVNIALTTNASGDLKCVLKNVREDIAQTVNLMITASGDDFGLKFYKADGTTEIAQTRWVEQIQLDTIHDNRTYLVTIRNYGAGIDHILINFQMIK